MCIRDRIIPDSEWKEEENKRIEGAKMLIVEDNESIKQMLAGKGEVVIGPFKTFTPTHGKSPHFDRLVDVYKRQSNVPNGDFLYSL